MVTTILFNPMLLVRDKSRRNGLSPRELLAPRELGAPHAPDRTKRQDTSMAIGQARAFQSSRERVLGAPQIRFAGNKKTGTQF